ncbi:MAG: BlaI/MecI/CopY family transcriptional regulator [Lachnospiraceae bacterium]|nr:BlaI/MecI/CopY family transcriptional regulator [Lachnospiraceae bacterium]
MNEKFFEEERNLSASETVIMKAIWDAKEDISIPDLIDKLREEYGKDYARTTVVTFLLKLSDKGFVRTYRKGKLSYAHIMKSEEDYKAKLLSEEADFWFEGQVPKMVSALVSRRELSKQDVAEIRSLLDGLDDESAK